MDLAGGLSEHNSLKLLHGRLLLAIWLMGLAFVILLGRLYVLQVLRGEEFTNKGKRNFVQQLRIPHDRGIIYDRYGRILVDNRPSIDIQITPAFLGKRLETRRTLSLLAQLLDFSTSEEERLTKLVEGSVGLAAFKPLLIKRDLTPEQIEKIESYRSLFVLDGVDLVEGRRRNYVYKTLAAHVLGYVNEIDGPTLEAERAKGNPLLYEPGDMLGRDGLERTYEKDLRGVDGFEKTVVDAKGRRQSGAYVDFILGPTRKINPQPGHNVFLTLDIELQQAAEAALRKYGQAGSVVVLDPRNGAVLALVSLPSYDPNLISGALAQEEKERLDKNPLTPWLHRAIQGQYAPGSTFKVVTALAALASKVTTPTEKIHCPGFFKLGKYTWRCHKDKGHGYVDLKTALKLSCDTYFYTMASRMGLDAIAKFGRMLNLGKTTGIALRGEKAALLPDVDYHNRVDKLSGGYQRGMAINAAIGQGSVLLTPLQLAVAYGAIADGQVWMPQIVEHIETADFRTLHLYLQDFALKQPPLLGGSAQLDALGLEVAAKAAAEHLEVLIREEGTPPKLLSAFIPVLKQELAMPPGDLALVRAGLLAVANEAGGTAYWHRSKTHDFIMAGKTGTAQVVRLGKDRTRTEAMDYFSRDHAWFVAYAPAALPKKEAGNAEPTLVPAEIVVAVLNEHAGHGGTAAAPIAVEVLETYFSLQAARASKAPSPPTEVSELRP